MILGGTVHQVTRGNSIPLIVDNTFGIGDIPSNPFPWADMTSVRKLSHW